MLNFNCDPLVKNLLQKEIDRVSKLKHSDNGGDQPREKADGATSLCCWWNNNAKHRNIGVSDNSDTFHSPCAEEQASFGFSGPRTQIQSGKADASPLPDHDGVQSFSTSIKRVTRSSCFEIGSTLQQEHRHNIYPPFLILIPTCSSPSSKPLPSPPFWVRPSVLTK
jgi:hypothetical protein